MAQLRSFPRRNPNIPEALIPSWIGVALQIGLSDVLAGLVITTLLANGASALESIVVGAVIGFGLTLTLQRTLWLLESALRQLQTHSSAIRVSRRWHGPLTTLATRFLVLVEQAHEVSELRDNLVGQVRDTAAQQERNRLARELHDSIKQQIFSINMSAAAAEARFDHDLGSARTSLQDIRSSAHEAMVEMTALLQQLAPVPLEKVGLQQAVRDQCEALGYRTGAAVTVEFGDLPTDERLPVGAQTSLFRIVQEALSNIARHARASTVRVYLGQPEPDARLALEITDDGQGFDATSASGGMGLANMRGRVQAMGGTLTIQSKPGHGSSLHILIPLLEVVDEQETGMSIQPNHTLNKVFAVGIGGGLALMAALYYPLYILLPANYVADWHTGTPLVGLLLQVVAFGLAIGIGYAAARVGKADSRSSGILFGAIAGGIAGLVLFGGLAVSAAGVLGNIPLIQHGLVPSANNAEFSSLIGNSYVWTMWVGYGGMLVSLIAGLGLGALGGLLYVPPAGTQPLDWHTLRASVRSPLIGVTVFGGMALTAIYTVGQLAIAFVKVNTYQSTMSPLIVSGFALLPLIIAGLCYVLPLASGYVILRHESKVDPLHSLWLVHPLRNAIAFTVLALTIPVGFIVSRDFDTGVGIVTLIIGAGSMTLVALMFKICWQARKQQAAAGIVPQLTVQQAMQYARQLGITLLLIISPFWVLIPHGIITLAPEDSLWPVFQMVTLALGILTGVLAIVLNRRRIRQQNRMSARNQSSGLRVNLNGIVATWAGVLVPALVNAAVLNLAFIPIIAVIYVDTPDPNFSYTPPPMTMSSFLDGVYVGHANTLVWMAVGAAVLVGIVSLFMWVVVRFNSRRIAQNSQTQTADA